MIRLAASICATLAGCAPLVSVGEPPVPDRPTPYVADTPADAVCWAVLVPADGSWTYETVAFGFGRWHDHTGAVAAYSRSAELTAFTDKVCGWGTSLAWPVDDLERPMLVDVADELGQWVAEGCPATRADIDSLAHASAVLIRLRDELRAIEAARIREAMAASSAGEGQRDA